MKSFLKTIGAVGALMISMPALAGFASVAHAEGLSVSNVNFASAQDVAAFKGQVEKASEKGCRARIMEDGTSMDACKAQVWTDVLGQLSADQRAAYESATGVKLAQNAAAAQAR